METLLLDPADQERSSRSASNERRLIVEAAVENYRRQPKPPSSSDDQLDRGEGDAAKAIKEFSGENEIRLKDLARSYSITSPS